MSLFQKPCKEKIFLQVISVFVGKGETCVSPTGSDARLISETLANKLQISGIAKEITKG